MRILLVDDDEDFRGALAANLRDDGHDVREYVAASSVPPLDSFTRVDAVITDYDMPGEDGLEFADRFHRAHPAVPIVLLTAYTSLHLEAQAARRDGLSLLRKPIDFEALHQMLDRNTRGGAG